MQFYGAFFTPDHFYFSFFLQTTEFLVSFVCFLRTDIHMRLQPSWQRSAIQATIWHLFHITCHVSEHQADLQRKEKKVAL